MNTRQKQSRHSAGASLPSTIWQGAFFSAHSLARVNRELVQALLELDPEWDVGLLAIESGDGIDHALSHPLQSRALLRDVPPGPQTSQWQVMVRHQFPPDWSALPDRHIAIQPWEFGAPPIDWVQAIRDRGLQLWVPSHFVRDCYQQGGVPAEQITVVPNGINFKQFHPGLKPLSLKSVGQSNVPRQSFKNRFKFLYVGGSIKRKGIDLLMKAYRNAFSSSEEVLLIVKDFGVNDVYAGQNYQAELNQWAKDPNAPPLLYIPETLSERDLASLYTAADCLVHPYRGEGFGLPIAEAMACGLPVIVTEFGACLDFCNSENAYFIPAKREALSHVGGWELSGEPFWASPSEDALTERLREMVQNPQQAKQRGELASKQIQECFSWRHAAEIASESLRSFAKTIQTPITFYDLGQARLQLDDADGALALFGKATDQNRSDSRSYAGAVNALLMQNRWDEAERLLYTALDKFPHEPRLTAMHSWFMLYTEQETEAWKIAQKLMQTGFQEDSWLKEVVLPLRDFFVCTLSEKGAKDPDTKKMVAALETYLKRHGIAIPHEAVGARITLCMIAKDEADMLADCLESARGCVDEIILVDTGSSDATIAVAQRYGAKVFHHPWSNDFSEARNVSLQHASGDWILWLDADERLTPRTATIIREGARHPQFTAYYLEILNVLDKESPQDHFVHRAVRFFRRMSYVQWEGRMHEQVLPVIQAHGGKAANLQNAQILHLGYEKSLMEQRGKSQRNVEILQRTLDESPQNAFQQFNLANTFYNQGDYERALPLLAEACEQIHPREDYAPLAWSQWITCLTMLQQFEEAQQVYQKAMARGVEHPLMLFAYAQTCLSLGNYPEAHRALQTLRKRAVQLGLLSSDGKQLLASSGYVGDPYVVTYKWHFAMARALIGLEQMEEAESQLRQAIEIREDYAEARYLLAEMLRRKRRPEQADKHYEAALRASHIRLQAMKDAANMWWELQRYERALPWFARLASAEPQEETWWHRWVYCAEQASDRQAQCEAFEFLEAQQKPLSANVHINWGRALWELGDYENALTHFVRAVETDPLDPNALFNAGDALYKIGAFHEAAEIYSHALEIDSKNTQGWFVLGNCYFRMGVYDAAQIAFQQALKYDPAHLPAAQNLILAEEMIRATAA